MNFVLAAAFSWLTLLGQGTGSVPDVKAVLAEFGQIQAQAHTDHLSRQEATARMAEAAKKAVAGLDVSKIPDEQTGEWLNVFRLADRGADVAALSVRAARYHTFQAWMAQQEELEGLIQEGKGEEAVDVFRYAVANQVSMLAQMAEMVHGSMTAKFIKTNPKVLFEAYDVLLARMEPSTLSSRADKQWGDICYANVSAQRLDLMFALGRKSEALAGWARLRSRFALSKSQNAYGETPAVMLDRMKAGGGMVRTPAAELNVQKTIGSFSGLSKLRGKVVVLDFFAHWCGPCKRAFPELRDFYTRYQAAGMELVGVTSFYGYYDAEQGLKPDQEYARMGKFVKDMHITWPVAFDASQSSMKSYGVGAIPQLVLIDRKGMVRMVQIGYEPEKKGAIEAELKALLAEKA